MQAQAQAARWAALAGQAATGQPRALHCLALGRWLWAAWAATGDDPWRSSLSLSLSLGWIITVPIGLQHELSRLPPRILWTLV